MLISARQRAQLQSCEPCGGIQANMKQEEKATGLVMEIIGKAKGLRGKQSPLGFFKNSTAAEQESNNTPGFGKLKALLGQVKEMVQDDSDLIEVIDSAESDIAAIESKLETFLSEEDHHAGAGAIREQTPPAEGTVQADLFFEFLQEATVSITFSVFNIILPLVLIPSMVRKSVNVVLSPCVVNVWLCHWAHTLLAL